MKSQKGGRVAMPFEYFNAGVKGPFTSNPAPATLARGMVDQSGCAMGPLQTGGKKTRRRRRRRNKSKQANNLQMNIVKKPRKRSRRRSRSRRRGSR